MQGAGYPGSGGGGGAAACPGAGASAHSARAHASADAPSHPDAVRTAGGRGRHGGVVLAAGGGTATAAALARGLGLPSAQARAFAATAAQARVRGPRAGEDDLAAAMTALQGGACLLTLVGPGGVGKTRLAVAVAAALAREGDLPARVWVVDLAPVRDPDLLVPAVARALGLRADAAPPTVDAMAARLAGRRALLLDTVERVAAPAGALAAALLAACPGLRVLATGRVALRVRGERVQPVDPLPVPPPDPLPDPAELARCPAVRLLVARARDARPGFRLGDDNAVASTGCRWRSSWPPRTSRRSRRRACWPGWRGPSTC